MNQKHLSTLSTFIPPVRLIIAYGIQPILAESQVIGQQWVMAIGRLWILILIVSVPMSCANLCNEACLQF